MSYLPNKAILPGYSITRILDIEGLTQKNLAERTGLTEKHISHIINGEASITVDTALLLENALGGTASFWLSLEANYQETTARIERAKQMQKEIPLLSKFPYKETANRGYVDQTTDKQKRVENLWRFFAVNSLRSVETTVAIAFRKNNVVKTKSEHVAAWLRCGEIEIKKMTLPEYSEATLKKLLPKIKALTVKTPELYSVELIQTLSEAGVGLVYIPHFPNTGVSGACRWVGNNPLIQISLRYPWADIFWFNLFHEIGHLLLHGKKGKFIEFTDQESTKTTEETEADNFASDELINPAMYAEFCKTPITLSSINAFADSIGIDKGIIIGRLCHDNILSWKDAPSHRTRLAVKEN